LQTYFAVLGLDGFEGIKRQVGYARAMGLLDSLRDRVAQALPAAEQLRANRNNVEFLLRARSQSAVGEALSALQRALSGEIPVRGRSLAGNVTIAAVPCPRGSVSETLVATAEKALAKALRLGRAVHLSDRVATEQDDHALMDDLHAALSGAPGLVLHYQPKLRAHGGALAGVEALLRWTHPTRGIVSPDLFIPLAERSGEIRSLTEWVIARAVADRAHLREAGVDAPVHVNISAQLVADPRFIDAALDQLGAATREIGFEITETAMMADPEGALANLYKLAEAGVHLSIDDYGSGFSSLAYLQRLPVKELKIDKGFVSRLSSGPRDPLLVRSTIDLAHALEMEVTAEGVQSAATLALLQVMRCDMVQGFFLSPALSLEGLVDYARDRLAAPGLPHAATLAERVAQLRRDADGTA
jgi:EAL domain-containing protein (putative c-di-GMP-specific phosphodiesterase class I)